MRLNMIVFPCELLLVCGAGWLLCGMPGHPKQWGLVAQVEDPWSDDVLAASLTSRPSLLAFRIVAEVESVRDPLNVLPDIRPGDVITGTYVYDSAAPDVAADPSCGNYFFSRSPAGIVLQVGGRRFSTDPRAVEFEIGVANLDCGDILSFMSHNNLCRPRIASGSSTAHVDRIWWCLHDFSGTALSGDELPGGALDLDQWRSLVGLRIEGPVTTLNSTSMSRFLISAKVTRTEAVTP